MPDFGFPLSQAVGERAYQELGSFETLKGTFEELLADLNSRMKLMQLVFFNDALEHLLRIIRILRLPQVSPTC